MEFRRIAAYVYKKNLKWRKAVTLAKKDKLYKDAMETAAQSGDEELAEELLRFFVDEKERACFAAMLYICYDLIKPDVAMEVAWMNGLTDLAMPYMIQVMREYHSKVDLLMTQRRDAEEQARQDEQAAREQEATRNAYQQLLPLALPAPPVAPQPGLDMGHGVPYGGMYPAGGVPEQFS